MLPIEQCYGYIVVLKEKEYKFLILKQKDTKDDNWSFVKGHTEIGETPEETAKRELEEEAGIKEIETLSLPLIHEEYEIFHHEEKRLKINEYFIGFVTEKNIKFDENEIETYKWATYEEALNTFTRDDRKNVLKEAKKYIENMVK